MSCKSKEEFHLEDLISDLEKTGVSSREQVLLKFFKRISENAIVDNIRNAYYFRFTDEYETYSGELEARAFWEDVKDAAEEDEYLGKIALSQIDKDTLEDAYKGVIGIKLYQKINDWFLEHDFIREDIVMWNCRVFRYLDANSMTKANIISGIFDHYESIRNIEEIHREVSDFLKKSIPSRILRVLETKIDLDERYYEYDIKKTEPTEQEKDVMKLANMYLKPLAEEIYQIVFRA